MENRVRLDVQDDEQIPLRAAPQTGLAVARRAQARAGVDPGRNAQLDGRGLLGAAAAAALAARLVEHAAGPLAARARLRDAEDASGRDDLAAPSAGRAGLVSGARFCAGAVTVVA